MAKLRLPPIGFWSYTRADDEAPTLPLTSLKNRIERELRRQLGREVKIFQDVSALTHGALWEQETKRAVAEASFFIPIAAILVAAILYTRLVERRGAATDNGAAYRQVAGATPASRPSPGPGNGLGPADPRQDAATSPARSPTGNLGSFCNQVNGPTDNPELDDMYMTAWRLNQRSGPSTDAARARQVYRDAAERGHRASQYNLAVMLHAGEGGAVDNPSAVHWFKLAANQGDFLAVLNLASAYSGGWPGIERNHARALEYYLQASRCDRGNVSNNIGVIYALGVDGVQRDLSQARSWFQRAETQGSRHAAENLSAIQDGFDPPRDVVRFDELGSVT